MILHYYLRNPESRELRQLSLSATDSSFVIEQNSTNEKAFNSISADTYEGAVAEIANILQTTLMDGFDIVERRDEIETVRAADFVLLDLAVLRQISTGRPVEVPDEPRFLPFQTMNDLRNRGRKEAGKEEGLIGQLMLAVSTLDTLIDGDSEIYHFGHDDAYALKAELLGELYLAHLAVDDLVQAYICARDAYKLQPNVDQANCLNWLQASYFSSYLADAVQTQAAVDPAGDTLVSRLPAYSDYSDLIERHRNEGSIVAAMSVERCPETEETIAHNLPDNFHLPEALRLDLETSGYGRLFLVEDGKGAILFLYDSAMIKRWLRSGQGAVLSAEGVANALQSRFGVDAKSLLPVLASADGDIVVLVDCSGGEGNGRAIVWKPYAQVEFAALPPYRRGFAELAVDALHLVDSPFRALLRTAELQR